jgi:hypothetical protein
MANQVSMMLVGNLSVDGGPARPCVVSGLASTLGTWGGVAPPYVDIGGPGNQPYPDQGLPGNQPYPDQGLPRPPLHTWGGGGIGDYIDAGFPMPQPPTGEQPPPSQTKWSWRYTEEYGWCLVPPGGGGKPQPTPPG